MPRRVDVLLTGGGTAGHVLPGLAVARALVARGHDPKRLCFVGASRGMEAELVPNAGFSITLLPGRGIERHLALANVFALAGLVVAGLAGLLLVALRRPRVVVMVGGYAGLACSIGAIVWRIPIVVVNVDSVPGAANRLVGRFAKRCAVATEATELPRAIVTGAPVREEVRAAMRTPERRARARAALALSPERSVIVLTGGSLGSGRLNEVGLALRTRFTDRDDITLYHVCGERNLEVLVARLAMEPPPRGLDYRIIAYEERLYDLFCAAEVVVARAGAMTIAELTVIGVPSVLVPLPFAPGDHQTENARRLSAVGGAVVVDDGDASGERIGTILEELLSERERLVAMEAAARTLGRPDAAAAIAAIVDDVAAGTLARDGVAVAR